jgi:hypothetical protein
LKRHLLFCLCLLPSVGLTAPWSFGEVLTIAGAGHAPHYHHLDGAGRRHIAASQTAVAVVWEDDRDGTPQVYLASKPREGRAFGHHLRLSTGREAYEPSIVALADGRWLAAWEQDGGVVACVIEGAKAGPLRQLAGVAARQVSLAADRAGRAAAVWVEQRGRGQSVLAAELRIAADRLELAAPPQRVAPDLAHPHQGYPSAVWNLEGQLVVAWEDRRAGHTRLFHAVRDSAQRFTAERQLNEHRAPDGPGLGSGVMRVALAVADDGLIQAIWLDKRNPAAGYAVWGATSQDGGESFGANAIVQDDLGATVPQWHAALAAGANTFVAAWDDTREAWDDDDVESGDVLLSWKKGREWSADLLVPGASGEAYQGSPALVLDPYGDLHLVWIVRDNLSSPTRLHYLHGARDDS